MSPTTTASSLESTFFKNQGKISIAILYSARNITLESKKKLLLKKKACVNSLKQNYVARNYRIQNKCIKCKILHHFLMCPDNNIGNSSEQNKIEIYETNSMTNYSNDENVFLMTLTANVKNKNVELKVRTIIDSGSQNSYVSKMVIEHLYLILKKIKMTHCLFGEEKNLSTNA